MFSSMRSILPTSRPALRPTSMPRLEGLEAREVPAVNPVDLGTSGHYAVLGLQNTDIVNGNATIHGDEGVSRGGSLVNRNRSSIDGDVHVHARNQYSGRGALSGSVVIAPSDMRTANDDAREAARDAAALTPTRTLNSVNRATTVTGNGGVNVIRIRGDISASLTLTGTADDVFIVNVSGSMDLRTRSSLSLSGGVSADNVIYNFVGRGDEVRTRGNSEVHGTLLALNRDILIGGDVHGGIIGGGSEIHLRDDAAVHYQATGGDTTLPPQPADLAGMVYGDMDFSGTMNDGESGLSAWMVYLTGDNQASLSTQTDSDGRFSFTGLLPGTYHLTVMRIPVYTPTGTTVGTVGGQERGEVQGDLSVAAIGLNAGEHAIDYLFGLMPPS